MILLAEHTKQKHLILEAETIISLRGGSNDWKENKSLFL
jgi:hypothetical protein